jgi:hypothetical protein
MNTTPKLRTFPCSAVSLGRRHDVEGHRVEMAAMTSTILQQDEMVNKTSVDAREAANDISNGLTETQLMQKYGLSAIGLMNLFDKLIDVGIVRRSPLQPRKALLMSEPHRDRPTNSDLGPVRSSGASVKTKVKVDAKQIIEDIQAGLGDSELMEKHRLSVTGLQSLFTKLLDSGIIDQQMLNERVHWSERTLSIKIHECPVCFMPQFEAFDTCPQCGVILSKLPRDKKNPRSHQKPERDYWVVETGKVKCKLKSNGKSMIVEGLNEVLQRRILNRLRRMLALKQKDLENKGRVAGSHFWVQRLAVAQRGRIKDSEAEKQQKEWLIEIGRFTIKPGVTGKSMIVTGLDEGYQKEVMSLIQLVLDNREHELDEEPDLTQTRIGKSGKRSA